MTPACGRAADGESLLSARGSLRSPGRPTKRCTNRLCAATDPLARSWETLERAQRIVIKFNMAKPPQRVHRCACGRRELVDESVARAVLRLLRERTSAKITAIDSRVYWWIESSPQHEFNYRGLLDEFGVEMVDASDPAIPYEVPGGGLMFRRYQLSACVAEADAVVSVAKLKNHLFQGVTLSLKNLFGLPPLPPLGRSRTYFHHIIRLSHVLPDLGLITQPCLNIVDGLVGQAGREWDGEGRIANVLFAGDHPIATDACGAWLMGHDPTADWPRAALPARPQRPAGGGGERVRHGESGRDRLPVRGGPPGSPVPHRADRPAGDGRPLAANHLRAGAVVPGSPRAAGGSLCGPVHYAAGRGGDLARRGSLTPGQPASLSGEKKDSAILLKLVDPEEREGEHFEVYDARNCRGYARSKPRRRLPAASGSECGMKLKPFKLERFFAEHEFFTRYLLCCSDLDGLSQAALLHQADDEARALWDNLRLGYTDSQGLPLLREEIARLYARITADDVLVVAPEEGIFLTLNAILQAGDHVICTFPGYQSLYEVAEGLGCEVTRWEPAEENGWRFDPDFLARSIRPNTRLRVVNFPHNPTGYLPPRSEFERILSIAREHGLYVLSDEMYRLLELDCGERLPAGCDEYDRAISLSGMSKTFGMAGVRIGWIATRDHELRQEIARLRDYTTICSSAPSEILSLIALRGEGANTGGAPTEGRAEPFAPAPGFRCLHVRAPG